MPFDAGVTAAVARELNEKFEGGRIEKIFMLERDVLILGVHPRGGSSQRILIDASASGSRICVTNADYENPKVPPMLCMLLRKYLTGARIVSVSAPVFDRVVVIRFETRDTMGFSGEKLLVAETMGRYGNLIFCDGEGKVLAAVRTSDITSGELRPIYPGASYSWPPQQNGKRDPLTETEEGFFGRFPDGIRGPRDIMNVYSGISPFVSRDLFERQRSAGAYQAFCYLTGLIKERAFEPCVIEDGEGVARDFCFYVPLSPGEGLRVVRTDSVSEAVERFYADRSGSERRARHTSDIHRIMKNAAARLVNKIEKQTAELEDCARKEEYRRTADLITANMYRLEKGMTDVTLIDYYSEGMEPVTVSLDSRLTPSQNAAKYYRAYNKRKTAETVLKEQVEAAKRELSYVSSVITSIESAENERDVDEIRRELADSGYLRKNLANVPKKLPESKPMRFRTSGGIDILCGKNNSQNELVTHRLAGKNDLWFHIKGRPGSHVILLCGDTEPEALDYTEAATVAAAYSDASDGELVAVDYTRVKNLKKPPASRPGYVTFSTNYSAYVTADRKAADRLRINDC
ncbi:MAG: NFACT family protein [Clostridia bacterium]|nr:NFACT family protein [Clostridia bacterium]